MAARTATSIRRILLLLAAALAAVLGHAACGWWSLETRTAPVGAERTAPPFSLPDHAGKAVSLGSLLERGPVVLVFYRGHW